MQLVTNLDRARLAFDNEEAMYKRAAQKVKDWRKAHDEMNQIEFAKLAKISVGCLQGFETATRGTRPKNLLKIATALGLPSVDALLSEDVVPAPLQTDPLVEGLGPEDLRLAHRYHHAGADAKYAVKWLLSSQVPDDVRERIALIIELLLRYEDPLLSSLFDLADTYHVEQRSLKKPPE